MLDKIKLANKRWKREQRRKFMRKHMRRTEREYHERQNKKKRLEAEKLKEAEQATDQPT